MGKAPKSQRSTATPASPNAREFFKFVKAVGTRYGGTYSDENEDGSKLPRVGFWSIYNEPNQPGWLTPQWKGSDARGRPSCTATSGTTAARRSTDRPQGRHRPDRRDGAAGRHATPTRRRRCTRSASSASSSARLQRQPLTGSSARRALLDAQAHRALQLHGVGAPPVHQEGWRRPRATRNRDSITMANIGELPALLDQDAGQADRGSPRSNLVALTEFGYETNPPDPFSGISPAKQAEYINDGRLPRLQGAAHHRQHAVPAARRAARQEGQGQAAQYFTYQSGLLYANGKPKPAAAAYQLPLVVTAHDAVVDELLGLAALPAPRASQSRSRCSSSRPAPRDFANVGDPSRSPTPTASSRRRPRQGGPGTWRASVDQPVQRPQVVSSREVETS